jgi:hypothetical protein
MYLDSVGINMARRSCIGHASTCDGKSFASGVAMTGGINDPTGNGPSLLLAEHHDELEAACADLRVAMHCGDPRELVDCYRAFEAGVVEHLRAEEDEILPAYGEFDPDDAAGIRNEHASIRARLYEIAVEVELHAIRAVTIEGIVEALRAHALHEDSGMYPWAEVHLPVSTRRQLSLRISQSLDTLSRLRRAFAHRTSSTTAPVARDVRPASQE